MFNHSHIRHFSSVFVSLRDFELITQNSSIGGPIQCVVSYRDQQRIVYIYKYM